MILYSYLAFASVHSQLVTDIRSVHNKIEIYLPQQLCLQRSSRGNCLEVPSTSDLIGNITEDQDQDRKEQSSHQIILEAETIKDLDKTIKKNSDAGIPSRNDEITKEVAKADETSLKRPVWTVSERESVFCYSDSDEQSFVELK